VRRAFALVISLALALAMAGGIACSSGDSVTGTGGSGGAAGATAGTGGSGGNAGTGSGGTTGAAGSGGTSGGFVNAATCGERGMATVNATSYSGYAEFFIIGEAGLGTDVCAIRFNVARVGAAPAGCTNCNWSHQVQFTNPTGAPQIGISEPWHVTSHHGDKPEKVANNAKINVFCLQMYARLLEKLRATPDGDGTLLDRSLIFYGSGMANSNVHATDPLPMVAVGGGVGKGSRHIVLPKDTPLGNLWLTVANHFDNPMTRFGESTGTAEFF